MSILLRDLTSTGDQIGASLDVTPPAAANKDVILLQLGIDWPQQQVLAVPPGFVLVVKQSHIDLNETIYIYAKISTGNEPANYRFELDSSVLPALMRSQCNAFSYYHDGGGDLEVGPFNAQSNLPGSYVWPSVTPQRTSESLLLCFAVRESSVLFIPDPAMVEVVDSPDPSGLAPYLMTQQLPNASAGVQTGTRTATVDPSTPLTSQKITTVSMLLVLPAPPEVIPVIGEGEVERVSVARALSAPTTPNAAAAVATTAANYRQLLTQNKKRFAAANDTRNAANVPAISAPIVASGQVSIGGQWVPSSQNLGSVGSAVRVTNIGTASNAFYGGDSVGSATTTVVASAASSSPSTATPPRQYATFVIAANDSTDDDKANANAVCAGTADEVEINAAFATTTPSTHMSVKLLDGTYNLAASILMVANSTLEGSGPATVLAAATNIAHVTGHDNARITNLSIDASITAGSRTGIAYVGRSGFSIDNVSLVDLSTGIALTMSNHAKIHNCTFDDGNNHVGVDLTSCSNVRVGGNTFSKSSVVFGSGECITALTCNNISVDGNTFDTVDEAIAIYEGNNCGVTNNVIHFGAIGVRLSNSGNPSTECTVSGNTIHDCQVGVQVGNSLRCNISANTVSGTPGVLGDNGIYLTSSEDCLVSGNQVQGFNRGLYISFSHRNSLSSNYIIGNSWSATTDAGLGASGNQCGIDIDESDDTFISGNRIRKKLSTSTNVHNYGINIDATSNNTLVANNDLREAGELAAINDAGVGTVTHLL